VEEGEGRLYPRSLQAASVVHALERGAFGEVPDCGDPAELICGFEAKEARRDPDGSFCVTAADGRDVRARRLLLASGGKAGIQYGCDGRGLKIAESLGHRIVRPIPALTGFVCEETDLLEKLAGVRVRGTVRLYAQQEGGEPALLSEDTGEIQFNKDSVSGICVMNVSGYYRRRGEERFFLSLDVLPEWDEAALAEKLARRKASLGDCFLDALLPEKLAAAVMEPAEKKGQTPESVAHLLKKLTFTPAASKGWKDAHTTSGGIALDEIDPKTMGSKLAPGLYAAGEALDVDGPCGGYSLTWAFASGWIAGQKAVRNG
ncbi:MAG: aminoacetone oxidase family FAD-binding enzyme, partial [Firmicutes bacterium]|nr:aminoacetone oxidase family FAD-binding enzyme [Bacillota bacterium]